MKAATSNLENDHVYILRLIDVMEHITRQQEANIEHLETIVTLIRDFADGLHHNKEVNLLFLKMAEKGFSTEQGPVAVMLYEHEQGRKYVKGMVYNIEKYLTGNLGVISTVYDNMLGYIELLRAHINKENNILFRMADKFLSDQEQHELLAEFERVERNPMCGGYVEGFKNQIDTLAKTYNIS